MKVYFIDEQLIEIAPPLWTWITFYVMEKDYKRVAIGCVVFDNFSGFQPTTSSISLSEWRDYQNDVFMCIMQPRIQRSVIFFLNQHFCEVIKAICWLWVMILIVYNVFQLLSKMTTLLMLPNWQRLSHHSSQYFHHECRYVWLSLLLHNRSLVVSFLPTSWPPMEGVRKYRSSFSLVWPISINISIKGLTNVSLTLVYF